MSPLQSFLMKQCEADPKAAIPLAALFKHYVGSLDGTEAPELRSRKHVRDVLAESFEIKLGPLNILTVYGLRIKSPPVDSIPEQLRALTARVEKLEGAEAPRRKRATPIAAATAGEYFTAKLYHRVGHLLEFQYVYAGYLNWCSEAGRKALGTVTFIRSIQAPYVVGRHGANQTWIGNVYHEDGPSEPNAIIRTPAGLLAVQGYDTFQSQWPGGAYKLPEGRPAAERAAEQEVKRNAKRAARIARLERGFRAPT